MTRKEIEQRILSKRAAIEICLHIPEKVKQLEGEIAQLEGELVDGN